MKRGQPKTDDDCYHCDGTGVTDCPEMCGADEDCDVCGGAGETDCIDCDGTGKEP